MKKVIRWILLVWTVITLPFMFEFVDIYELFFGLLYAGIIIGLMVSDLREHDK